MAKNNKGQQQQQAPAPNNAGVVNQLQDIIGHFENVVSAEMLIAEDDSAANLIILHEDKSGSFVECLADDNGVMQVIGMPVTSQDGLSIKRTRPVSKASPAQE